MPNLEEITFRAFREEIKTASRLQGALSGLGAGVGLGALAGGAAGAYRGYRQAKERGESGLDAAISAAKGAPMGAALGGGLGAGIGAGAGALVPHLGESLAQHSVVGAPVRFAQRQVHGVTGWEPRAGIESIGGGAHAAKQNLHAAHAAVGKATEGVEAAEAAHKAGLGSLPGYLRGLAQDPKGTLQKGFNEQWKTQGAGMKAITLGLPAIEAAHAATSDDTPGGPGKAERVGRSLLPAAGGLVTGALPFTSQLAVGGALGALGAGAGRVVDRLRGHQPAPAPGLTPGLSTGGGA